MRGPASDAVTGLGKVLVPQGDLFESAKPFDKARRLWTRRGEAPPRKVNLAKNVSWVTWEEQLLWTPGMLKPAHLNENESKVVEYQSGQLKCTRSFSGELSYTSSGPDKKEIKFNRKYTVWPHSKLPLGFAEARIESERILGDMKTRMVITYRLQDFGTDAKSELPESN